LRKRVDADGYLIDTFLWEAANRRTDRWGMTDVHAICSV
jgi:2,4-dienoyl-CoA reductase-like NADH-dependent reductase (Old Yellow Enzyme family)